MAWRTTAYSSSRRAMRSFLRLPGWALSASLPRPRLCTGRVASTRERPELTGSWADFRADENQLNMDMASFLAYEPTKRKRRSFLLQNSVVLSSRKATDFGLGAQDFVK